MSEKQQQRQYVDCTTALDVTMSCASCSKPTMGEKQKVLIAMDGSEHSFSAFDCEYIFFLHLHKVHKVHFSIRRCS